MNQLINQLFAYYDKKYSLLKNNEQLLNETEIANLSNIKSTLEIIGHIKKYLSEKEYNKARLVIDKLNGIDHKHIAELHAIINQLEIDNMAYSSQIAAEIISQEIRLENTQEIFTKNDNYMDEKYLLALKELKELIYDLKLNNTQHISNEISDIKIQISSLEKNIANLSTSILELKAPVFHKETLDQLSKFCDTINDDKKSIKTITDNIITLEPNINNISTELKNINLSINKSLNEINNEYFEATKTHKENTINTINEVQKSTIATVKLISSDLPDKVSKIIGKTLWSNYIFFCMIFFVLVLSSIWIMGIKVGHTMAQDMLTVIHNNHNSEQPIDKKSLKSKAAH